MSFFASPSIPTLNHPSPVPPEVRVFLQVVLSNQVPGIFSPSGLKVIELFGLFLQYDGMMGFTKGRTSNEVAICEDRKTSLDPTFLRIAFKDNYGVKKQDGLRCRER